MVLARALLALLLVTLAASVSVAETRVALVVGNGAYAHAPSLPNPLNDARDVSAALKATGFDVVEALDADKAKLDAALRSFADKLANADVALFFYAGHGLQLGLQNYLVPVDAKLERERDLEFEAVKLDFVMRQMEIDRDGKTTIVILDACRDNPLARNLARSMGTRSVSIGRGLAAAATGLGTFIAYATQPGNVALDGDGRNSPFTTALVKHMREKGRNLPATMIEVRKDVVAATNGAQVPWDHSALTGEFYFVPVELASAPARGSVTPAPAASSDDISALKERLARLEAEAKTRDAAPASGSMISADGIRLAELRARAANVEDQVKDLQKRLMDSRREEGRAANPDEKMKLLRRSGEIQMEWTRRGLDLRKLRDEIAALETKAQPAAAAAPANIPPVTAAPDPDASAADFEGSESVRLDGTVLRSFRAPSPDACRNACADEARCIGYQHGRKIGVMGQCDLLSEITSRHEDSKWRSGVRRSRTGGPGNADDAGAKPNAAARPQKAPTRSKQGFDFFEQTFAVGKMIKQADADSADGCMIVCRNTPDCKAASYSQLTPQSKRMCVVFESIQSMAAHTLSGTSVVIVRQDGAGADGTVRRQSQKAQEPSAPRPPRRAAD